MSLDLSQPTMALQGMGRNFLYLLPYLVIAAITFALFYIGARYAGRAVLFLVTRRAGHRNLGVVLGRLTQGGLILLGVLVALVIAVPSFKPAQLVQLPGISGVAVGFAFRDILQNFLAGILILLTEPFRIGDQIVVGKFEGTVEDIETRATFIKTYDGRRVVIPNSTLFTDSVVVNTAYPSRRLQFDLGIGYGDDIARARDVMLEAMRGIDSVLADPAPEVLVVDLGASTVNLRARWWVAPPRRTDVIHSASAVIEAFKDKLTAAGIDLPFPTTQVLFHDQTDEWDGDRARQREGWPAGDEVPAPRPLSEVTIARVNE